MKFNQEKFIAMKEALKQRGKCSQEYKFGKIKRWFYTFKVIVCLFLGRYKRITWGDDYIDSMAIWNVSSWWSFDFVGTAYDWTELAVGKGIFTNWFYDIYGNSSA